MSDTPDLPSRTQLLRSIDRRRGILFASVALLYLLAFNGQLRVSDDNCYYTRVGINLAEGRGYTYHGLPDTLAFPGLPYLIAAGYRIAPGHGQAVAHGLLLAMGLGTLIATYWLIRQYAVRSLAVLTFVVLACTRTMHEHTFRLLTDGPFVFGTVLTLLGYALLTRQRGGPWVGAEDDSVDGSALARPMTTPWWAWGLFTIGLTIAVFSRVIMMALVLSIGLVCVWRILRGPGRWRHVVIGLLTLGVISLFYMIDPRRPPEGYVAARTYESGLVRYLSDVGGLLHRTLTQFGPMLFNDAASMGFLGLEFDPVTNTILSAGVLTLGFVGAWRRPLWMMFWLITLAVMLMFTPAPRYFLPLLPIVCFGFAVVFRRLGLALPAPWCRIVPGAMLVVVLVPNVIKDIDLIIEQRRVPFLEHYNRGKYATLQDLGRALTEHIAQDDQVLGSNPSQLTLYSDGCVVHDGIGLLKRRDMQQAYDYLAKRPAVYVIQPARHPLKRVIEVLDIQLGPTIVEVPGVVKDDTGTYEGVWTLHLVTAMSPPQPRAAP